MPDNEYYARTVCLDEFGRPMADIVLSDPIRTLQPQVSDVTVDVTLNKYFNGDDIYAQPTAAPSFSSALKAPPSTSQPSSTTKQRQTNNLQAP